MSFGVAKAAVDGKSVLIGGSLEGDDLYHVFDLDAGKVVQRYQLKDKRGVGLFAPGGNLVAMRSMTDVRVIELPPLPKR